MLGWVYFELQNYNRDRQYRCLEGRMVMHACQIGPTDTAPPCPGSPQWVCVGTNRDRQYRIYATSRISYAIHHTELVSYSFNLFWTTLHKYVPYRSVRWCCVTLHTQPRNLWGSLCISEKVRSNFRKMLKKCRRLKFEDILTIKYL